MITYLIKAVDQGYSSTDLQKLADYINGLGRIMITRADDDEVDINATIEVVRSVSVEGDSLLVDVS